jgi:hypothetical protein
MAKTQDGARRNLPVREFLEFMLWVGCPSWVMLGALAYLATVVIFANKAGWPLSWSLITTVLGRFAWATVLVVGSAVVLIAGPTVRRQGGRWLGALVLVLLWPCRVAHRARHSAGLAEWLVARAVACLPGPYRAQYEAVWLGEIDWQRQQGRPVLGWAIGVAGTAVFTRLALHARLAGAAERLRELPKSGPARAVRQAKPIWLGVLTAVSVFCTAAVGWSGVGQQGPSRAQLLWAISASVLAGGGMTWQTWPRGPAAEERREEEHL